MSKPVVTMMWKKSLRRHEKETLRVTRLKREPVFIGVTVDSAITNNSFSKTVYKSTTL